MGCICAQSLGFNDSAFKTGYAEGSEVIAAYRGLITVKHCKPNEDKAFCSKARMQSFYTLLPQVKMCLETDKWWQSFDVNKPKWKSEIKVCKWLIMEREMTGIIPCD